MRILRKNMQNKTVELELKKENCVNKNVNFSDLITEMQSFGFQTKHYDKPDNFNFDIISMSYKSSNIPRKMF